jgi:hypothetical protein
VLGQNTVVVEGIPADAPLGREKKFWKGFIEQFKWNQSQIQIHTKRI